MYRWLMYQCSGTVNTSTPHFCRTTSTACRRCRHSISTKGIQLLPRTLPTDSELLQSRSIGVKKAFIVGLPTTTAIYKQIYLILKTCNYNVCSSDKEMVEPTQRLCFFIMENMPLQDDIIVQHMSLAKNCTIVGYDPSLFTTYSPSMFIHCDINNIESLLSMFHRRRYRFTLRDVHIEGVTCKGHEFDQSVLY